MAFALVASVDAAPGANGGATGAIDTTGADLLVVTVAGFDVGATLPTDSKSNTWNALTLSEDAISGTGAKIFWSKPSSVGTGHTATFSETDVFPTITFLAFSGSHATQPDAAQNGAATNSATSLSTGSVTPAAAGSLLVSVLAHGGAITNLAIDNSLTIVQSQAYGSGNNMGGGTAWKEHTTGAINPAWSWTTSMNAATRIAVFAPAAAGGDLLLKLMHYIGG